MPNFSCFSLKFGSKFWQVGKSATTRTQVSLERHLSPSTLTIAMKSTPVIQTSFVTTSYEVKESRCTPLSVAVESDPQQSATRVTRRIKASTGFTPSSARSSCLALLEATHLEALSKLRGRQSRSATLVIGRARSRPSVSPSRCSNSSTLSLSSDEPCIESPVLAPISSVDKLAESPLPDHSDLNTIIPSSSSLQSCKPSKSNRRQARLDRRMRDENWEDLQLPSGLMRSFPFLVIIPLLMFVLQATSLISPL
ncbi:hypothetical protein DFH28DRAFT_1153957 [Melampsora americana]|nr:hypothetical protein DFH28DRAFT_1153957 [Melampsora americana]